MDMLKNELYMEDLEYISSLDLPWEKLEGAGILISGSTGMIGSFLIDALMYRNMKKDMGLKIYAAGRSAARAEEKFSPWFKSEGFEFISWDIKEPYMGEVPGKVDYVLHLASPTHPLAYSSDPIGTIRANVMGTYNMLEFAMEHRSRRALFASSNEIYGENRGDTEKFDESYCGYIDCNTLRAGYPESKRCAEALCQAYIKQKGMDIVIPRLTRTYGPTLAHDDTKALSQFIKKAVKREDIVLKSEGKQYYSYLYAADTVSGLLTVLLKGKKGEAYNVADSASDIRLKDLSQTAAEIAGTKVVFELPEASEKAGYSTATKARLNSEKLKRLGWRARYDIDSGLERTVKILKSCGYR